VSGIFVLQSTFQEKPQISTPKKPIAIYHEHQDWFRPLFSEFERRGTLYIHIDARQHRFDIAKQDGEFSLLFNRMSPSAYTRGNGHGLIVTRCGKQSCLTHVNLQAAVFGIDGSIAAHQPRRGGKKKSCDD